MSWSFQAIGKPEKVLEKALRTVAGYHLPEPENTIKNKFLEALEASLSAMPDNVAVRIEAFGSQSPTSYFDETTGKWVTQVDKFSNSLTVKIEPLHGFLS